MYNWGDNYDSGSAQKTALIIFQILVFKYFECFSTCPQFYCSRRIFSPETACHEVFVYTDSEIIHAQLLELDPMLATRSLISQSSQGHT